MKVEPQWPDKIPTKIAFVGEAPEEEEVEKGKPFVGPSGRLFNTLMRTAGLDRTEYMITNVFSEKLPDNDVSNWCSPLGEAKPGGYTDLPPIGSAGFLRPEYRWHLERLREELCQAQPTVIVPLGGTALWALTGQTGIAAHRGSVAAASQVVPGHKIIPTFHPKAVMHQWKFYPVVVGDLIRARAEAERGPAIILPKRELILEPTIEDINDAIPRLAAGDPLSVDIETGWGQLTCIGFAPSAEYAICVPFLDKRAFNRNYWLIPEQEAQAWKLVRRILDLPNAKLGQNFGGYDFYWLLEKYNLRARNMTEDTRLLHHAIYPELPKGLEFMGNSYATQGAWKQWGKKQEKRDD